MGDGDVEDGIRSSVSSAINVGLRLGPALLLWLLLLPPTDVDADVDLLEGGGGVAVDKRRRFGGGGPPVSDPFGLPNVIFPLSPSSTGDSGKTVAIRSRPFALGVVGGCTPSPDWLSVNAGKVYLVVQWFHWE